MRKTLGLIALGGALALAGCASSKERVTLLSPAIPGKGTGAVVVEYADGSEAYLTAANQQAKLRGEKEPRFDQLDEADPVHTEIMGFLPKHFARDFFYFATGEGTLSKSEMDRLQAFLAQNIENRPGAEIEIAAHTDATGNEAVNNRVSAERAQTVLGQVRKRVSESNLPIKEDDIEAVASSWHWARSSLQPGQEGQPNRAYRVVVVTVR
ncbi:OmpA family protein [Erythrobacter sp. SCSIO 43205]|uniref:OmpA family protein n=1 Tax=Erythrobacter sp. SCSIO 43205 TaxID=2779361 RepID=UPI001CA92431|nr:OmpA family protein [Erythrobacter sp. SCSIO 43205]UAB77633.1 OmpA family protein [Erythrobacter sp. SCSIO 43205]